MKVREAIQGLQEIRGILTKKERCFSDVMAKRAADSKKPGAVFLRACLCDA